MDKEKVLPRWQEYRPTTRRLIQLYSALLHNANLKGFVDGEIYQGRAKVACVPGLNCYSCPGAVGACPLGSLQNALASSGHRAGWYVLGVILLFGITLGRTVCGWLCPMGLIQELLHKIPTPKLRRSRATRWLSNLKFVILAVFVIAIPLWVGLRHDLPMPAFCQYICPAGTLEGAVGLLSNPRNSDLFGMLGISFTRKFVILILIVLGCVFCYRGFCRFLCPLGAIYSLFNRFCLVGVKVDAGRCNGCGACVCGCGMDVKHVGDRECIHCAKCMEACGQKAISLRAGGVVLKAPEGGIPGEPEPVRAQAARRRNGRLAWGVALAALCAALLWFNFQDPSGKDARNSAPAPGASPAVQVAQDSNSFSPEKTEENVTAGELVGAGVGMRLQDFTVACLDGSEFHLADTRGKVVFLNLWATWCAPCVQELPCFNALYREHEGEVAVLAIHSSLTTEDPAEFVSGRGWDISFCVDSEDDELWSLVDGSSTLPQTIVLNRRGEVVYNQKGSVTPEMLAALYDLAAEG